MDLLERLRKQATCVYIAVDEGVADDLADGLKQAIAEIERLRMEVALWKDRYEAADRDMKAMVADYEDYLNGLKHK